MTAFGLTYGAYTVMKNKAFRFAGFCLVLCASLLVTCDPFQEEENLVRVNTLATDYYILPNSSAVIDLKGIVSASFTDISVKVSEYPRRGTLTSFDGFLFKYTPSSYFTEQVESGADDDRKDQFKVRFGNNEGIVDTQVITIHMIRFDDYVPCSLIAVEDAAHTMPGASVSVKILFNDRLCGIKVDDVDASISVDPKYGQAAIKNDSLIYTPEIDFEGLDEIVYKISAGSNHQISGSDDLLVSYGLITINVRQ